MEDIQFAAKAFGVVMTGMALITAFLYLLRYVAQQAEPKAVATADPSSESDPSDDPELIAVLAAAAHTALGSRVRIHQVHLLPRSSAETWARAGRMDIMFSHRVERKR